MAVDTVDAQIQGLISQAKIEANAKTLRSDESDDGEQAARRRLDLKKASIRRDRVDRQGEQHDQALKLRLAQVIGGSYGQEPAAALLNFERNEMLQSKLTETQREQFREAIAKDPQRVAKSGQALQSLSQTATFDKAVRTSQQAGLIQDALLRDPKTEGEVGKLLSSRFMQWPKADDRAKHSLLRFGIQKGSGRGLDTTLEMMGSLSKHAVGREAQQASMTMAHRQADNPRAMSTVNRFVLKTDVHRMPMAAKTKATELVAKSDGSAELAERLGKLASDPKFKGQSAENQGRFFATIGSGRPSEFRQLADQSLRSLASGNFPARSSQVGRFLGRLQSQVSRGGAASVEIDRLISQAKRSPLPQAPVLTHERGLSGEDVARVRRDNRAKIIQFYTQVARSYDRSEKRLNSAKYFEDINRMADLREPEDLDLSALAPEERALAHDRRSKLSERLGNLRQMHRQRSRELRTKRMPMAKRRAQAAASRTRGSQPRYFNPRTTGEAGRWSPAEAFVSSQSAPQTATRHGAFNGGGDIRHEVSAALAELGRGPLSRDMAESVARRIASQVADRVASQVTEQLLSASTETTVGYRMSGQKSVIPRDGWGIPRHCAAELGGNAREVVKPKVPPKDEPRAPGVEVAEPYVGRMLVKDATGVRPLQEMMSVLWKALSRSEQALLKNLDWNQQTWDTKESASARWPASMATPFLSLSPLQRESLKKLGQSAYDWDKRIQTFSPPNRD